MSGTSLDGLDLADVTFHINENNYDFHLNNGITLPFGKSLVKRLKNSANMSGLDLMLLSKDLEVFQANAVEKYLKDYLVHRDHVNFVAAHGHTVFHQPQNNWTLQIGNGPRMASMTGLPWICDFRSMDLALGGQGAPLVPIGDLYLFGKYADGFLNLGGFANLSFKKGDLMYAYDICPVNVVLNKLANNYNMPYDEDGKLSNGGKVITSMLSQLNALSFYEMEAPKSLGIEWVNLELAPILEPFPINNDLFATFYSHVAQQIVTNLEKNKVKKVFISGGGAFNKLLIGQIDASFSGQVVLPTSNIIAFKEAIIFAFLGLRRWEGKTNVLASVTGATRDSSSGIIHLP